MDWGLGRKDRKGGREGEGGRKSSTLSSVRGVYV